MRKEVCLMAPVRILWDEQEVAVLMDYFIQYNTGIITRSEAVSKTSKELRERAKRNGIAIDDVFRNENGIAMQMSKVEDLFVGKKGRLSKAPKIFEDIVDKYQNDRTAFDKILREVREVSDDNLSVQEEFFNWLDRKISPAQMSELYFTYSEIESFCISCKILKKPLFETTELSVISAVKSMVDSNKIFRFTHKKKIAKMQSAIKFYYDFLKEIRQSAMVTILPVEQTTQESRPIQDNEIKSVGESKGCVVSFGSDKSYAFTRPISLLYFDNEYQVKNWTQLFVRIVCCLYEDYPDIIRGFIGTNISGKGRIDIADDSLVNEMAAPKELTGGLFLETNLCATDITLKIKQLLDFCKVDYENVIITYITTKSDVGNADKLGTKDITEMPTNLVRVASSSDSKDFLRWMIDEQHMAASSGRSYASGINNCEQMAIKLGLKRTHLYGESYDEAQKTANMLMQTNEYQIANNRQHNRLRASLSKFLQYLFEKEDMTIRNFQVNDAKPLEDLMSYTIVLREHFPKGYRVDSTLDLKRFIRYYNGVNGTEWDVSDENVRNKMRRSILQVGVRHGEYIFAGDSLVSEDTKGHILTYIENSFSQGKRVIYYRALFEEFNEEFLGQRIYDEDMLRAYLMHECGKQYVFEKNFISQERNVYIDPKNEIRELLISYGAPMKTEEMYEKLLHLPADRIDWAIHTNKEFVCNTWGEYFHVSLIDLSDDELEEIEEIIQQRIDESHFVSGNELVHAIRKRYPSMLERFPQVSLIGIRDAIAYYMSDRFSFNGNIISSLQKQLSMSDVFAEFAKTHTRFTIDELNVLKNEMNSTICFDSVYENSLRVSQHQFVSREEAGFDVSGTDKAISAFCTGEYISLAGITSFGTFPYANFPWNIYLLEHYVATYSVEYKLLHTSFNADNCVGAIVKKSSGINNLNDLITDVLAHSDIKLNKKDALQYLCDKGYLARRRFSDIDQILIKARAKRG